MKNISTHIIITIYYIRNVHVTHTHTNTHTQTHTQYVKVNVVDTYITHVRIYSLYCGLAVLETPKTAREHLFLK